MIATSLFGAVGGGVASPLLVRPAVSSERAESLPNALLSSARTSASVGAPVSTGAAAGAVAGVGLVRAAGARTGAAGSGGAKYGASIFQAATRWGVPVADPQPPRTAQARTSTRTGAPARIVEVCAPSPRG